MNENIVQFVPKPRGGPKPQPTPIEAARTAIIDRVAKAIWDADGEDTQPWPDFNEFVANAYEVGDPAMLEQVADTYRRARAAIWAMSPPEPDHDEAVSEAVSRAFETPLDPSWIPMACVTSWVEEVLK